MSKKIIQSISAIVFARLILNITKRFPYPFVAAIGASFHVPAASIQNVIALTNGSGLLSPLLGAISEHYGRKAVMVGILAMMSLMSLVGALFADYGIFVVVMFAFGIGKIIYDPTFQAYLGDVIHFKRRARVMGIAELSWALSLVIAAPLTGFLLDASSLQAVFAFLTVALAVGAAALWLFVEIRPATRARPPNHCGWSAHWRQSASSADIPQPFSLCSSPSASPCRTRCFSSITAFGWKTHLTSP